MGNNELRRKETVESQLEKKSSSKSQDSSSMSYIERAKNGVGIAFADALKAADTVLKATTVGLAIQGVSGLDRAHALSQSNASDTALAHRGNGKITELHPGIDQKGLPHPSNQTDLERSLRKVTPEELKQMGVKNPERFMRKNVQKLEQNLQQREQKR